MERGSDKHGPRLDEALHHDVESLLGGSPVEARAQEWREQEGPADGEPTPDSRISGDRWPTPPDMLDADEVEARADLARHLPPSVFPARTDELVAAAERLHAPADVVDRLRSLPDDTFPNVAALWQALGGHREHRG
ncbi:MAG TPA: DUF2795 domain-containing protein [Acidimicrobiia bacterium]|jgi:hypothetical protein|nr:DUF2795 domain-containing protein [Acidimicrobiia bacterium]